MESHSDVTELTQQEDHSETENNEKQQKSTPYSQKLPFDEDLEFSNLNSIQLEKVYNELRKAGKPKFQERFPFPDIKVLVRLARRVYKEGTNDQKLVDMEMPDGWQLLTTAFNKKTLNGYFGAAYWNPKEQQIVVAHRGTSFRNEGALWTDLKGILNNKTVPQMKSAITFAHTIKVIVEELNKRDDVFLQLSFTGHSLGGLLAQVTTLTTKHFSTKEIDKKLLFVKSKTVGYHAHTVAFDSPGCKEMLLKIKRRYDLSYNKDSNSLEIDDLDITTYLSAPNFINTLNSHVGTLYRVFTGDAPRGSLLQYTKKVHNIKRIENVFSSDKKDKTREVMDWPLVHKGITERLLDALIKNKIITMVNSVKGLFTEKEGDPLPRSRHYNQYEYFHRVAESFHQEAEGIKDYNPDPDDKDGYCVIRYQVKEVYKRQHSTNAFTLEELDFLSQYKILRDNPVKKLRDVFNQFGDEAHKIEDALKRFEMDEREKIIRCESEDELEKLICYVKYIIRFSPRITVKIKTTLRDDPVWFRVNKLNEPFVGRTKELEQLLYTHILREEGKAIPVITGLEGVGKSELALKYVREYYGINNSIIWINAENKESQNSSFKLLHTQLFLKCREEDGEEKMELVVKDVYKYLTANNESSILIFDNAENYNAIKKFLPQGLYDSDDKIHILITSNNSSDWTLDETNIEPLKLNEFNDDEAITFVKNSLKIKDDLQDKEIKSLVQTLPKFPLALQQAAAYIQMMKEYRKDWNREYNISDYLTEYDEEPKKMLGSENEDRNRGVFSILNVTINKIKANEKFGEEALNMLGIISYLAPNNIPVGIFINKLTNIHKLILNTQPLIKYSIVRLEKGMLNVHGLVQQIMKLKIEEKEEKILKKLLQLLTEYIAASGHDKHEKYREKKECDKIELCTPHILSVWNHACKYVNLVDEYLIRGKRIKIPETNTELSVTYFNLIAAGCKYEIVKEIIDKIEEKYPKECNKVRDFINRRNIDKESALHGAAKNGKEQTVKLLVSKGADVNAMKKYGWTPLSLAGYNGHLSIVQYLSENGGELGWHRTGREYTELPIAPRNGNMEAVDLISEDTDENIIKSDFNLEGNYPKKKRDANALQKVPEVKIPNKDGDANEKASKDVSYVNAKDQRLFTALHFAVKNDHLEIIKVLLENKRIDVNAKTEWERTPLHFAVENGNVESVKVLLNEDADVNAKTQPDSLTPLHLAVLDGNKDIIRYLLHRKEIDIDAQTTEGNTALHLAAEKGNLPVVEVLIQKNADATIVNKNGKLASDLADETGHPEVKNYIEKISENIKRPHEQVE